MLTPEKEAGNEQLGLESWSWLAAGRALICCPKYAAMPSLKRPISGVSINAKMEIR